jgi:hypothetical protein
MPNCASGNLEIPGSLVSLAPRSDEGDSILRRPLLAFAAHDRGKPAMSCSNGFVIGPIGCSRTIAYKGEKTSRLLSTLIEACASQRRGFAISNEEQSDV